MQAKPASISKPKLHNDFALPIIDLINTYTEIVITTDAKFIVTGINDIAQLDYGFLTKNNIGKYIFGLKKFEILGSEKLEEAILQIKKNKYWTGKIVYKSTNNYNFNVRCLLLQNNNNEITGYVFVINNITQQINQEKNIQFSEKRNETIVKSLASGMLIVNNKNIIVTANEKAIEVLKISKETIENKVPINLKIKAITENGTNFLYQNQPQIITLQTGIEKNNVIMGLEREGEKTTWLSINTRSIYKEDNKKPYAVVISMEDITEEKKIKLRLAESELMLSTFVNNSQNLSWVFDEKLNFIYGNALFMKTFGLKIADIGKNIKQIASTQDAKFITNKQKTVFKTGQTIIGEDILADENKNLRYFISHKFLLKFNNNKKYVGGHALEITERKKFEKELLNQQLNKQQLINQAIIDAQEKERDRISADLQDNVNQLLVSSRMHIAIAKSTENNVHPELLSNATDYLMMAIDEIKTLSLNLSSEVIVLFGLQKSIEHIAQNLQSKNEISTKISISTNVIEKITLEQQIMIYRILQEQSQNIIKHSKASIVNIILKEENNHCYLLIKDNGNGFNNREINKHKKGIGFVNIFNRVQAYNGVIEIETSPGNGCVIQIKIPLAIKKLNVF